MTFKIITIIYLKIKQNNKKNILNKYILIYIT